MKREATRTKTLIWIFLPILLFLGFLASLPSLISTQKGKELFLSALNRSIPGTIDIQEISLSWSGFQKIKGLTYKATQGNMELSCIDACIEAPLTAFLWQPYSVRLLKLHKPACVLFPEKGTAPAPILEAQKASLFGFETKVSSWKKNLSYLADEIQITDGSFSLLSSQVDPILLTLTQGTLIWKKEESTLSAYLEGSSEQGSTTSPLTLSSVIRLTEDFDLTLQILCPNLSLKGIDPFIALFDKDYKNDLSSILGSSLRIGCDIHLTKDLCHIDIDLSSERMKTHLEMGSKENQAFLVSPAIFQLELNEPLLEKLIPGIQSSSPLSLTFQIDSFILPLEGKFGQNASFFGQFSSSPYKIHDTFEVFVNGTISSQNLQEECQAQLLMTSKTKKSSSQAEGFLSIQNLFTDTPKIAASCSLNKLPTAFLDDLMIFSPFFSSLMGHEVSAFFSFDGTMGQGTLSCSIDAPFIKMTKTSISLHERSLTLIEPPGEISYLNPPVLFTFLDLSPSVIPLSQAPITLQLLQVQLKDLAKQEDFQFKAILQVPAIQIQKQLIDPFLATIAIDSLAHIDFSLQGKELDLTSSWAINTKTNTLSLIKALKASCQLALPPFIEKASLAVSLAPFDFPLHTPFTLPSFSAIVTASQVELSSQALPGNQKRNLTIDESQLTLAFSKEKNILSASFQSHIQKGLMQGSFSLLDPLSHKALLSIQGKIQGENLSLSLLDDLACLPHPLTPFLGDNFDFTLDRKKNGSDESFVLTIQSPLTHMSGTVKLTKDRIILAEPASPLNLIYQLTPEGYQALLSLWPSSHTPLDLKEKTTFKASLLSCSIPYSRDPFKVDLTQFTGTVSLENDKVIFTQKDLNETVSLFNTKTLLQKTGSSPLALEINTSTESLSSKGSLRIKGTLDPLSCQASLEAKSFPSGILDVLYPSGKELFSHLLGASFTLNGNLLLEKNSGPITLDLSSPVTQLHLKGRLDSGILTLQEHALAEMNISPKVGKFLLKGANPLSIQSFSTEAPIVVEIGAKQFSFPLNPFSFSKAKIPFIRISPGKIHCQNEGNLNQMLRFLKSKQAESKELMLWIAPIDLHVDTGVVQVERTEILLAQTYDIALWGAINLPGDFVDMTLGLPASTLEKALKIKKLPRDYVLTIPLKGPLGHVELNSTIATSKIAALMLWQSGAIEKGLGPFGGILKQVVPPPGSDARTPPPKTPFPWDPSRR